MYLDSMTKKLRRNRPGDLTMTCLKSTQVWAFSTRIKLISFLTLPGTLDKEKNYAMAQVENEENEGLLEYNLVTQVTQNNKLRTTLKK